MIDWVEEGERGVTVTTWSRVPETATSLTPSIDCSSGTTVEFSFAAKARWSPSEVAASVIVGMSPVLPVSTCGSTPSGSRALASASWMSPVAVSMSVS